MEITHSISRRPLTDICEFLVIIFPKKFPSFLLSNMVAHARNNSDSTLKEPQTIAGPRRFKYQMLGMLEALDSAASVMKDPKDILLIDLDNQGKWKIMTRDQINKALRAH